MENVIENQSYKGSYDQEYLYSLNNYYRYNYENLEDWLVKCTGAEKITREDNTDRAGFEHIITTMVTEEDQAIIMDYPRDILITDKQDPNHVYDSESIKDIFRKHDYLDLEPDDHMTNDCLKLAILAKIDADRYNVKFEDRLGHLVEDHKRGLIDISHEKGEKAEKIREFKTKEISKEDSRLLKNIMESAKEGITHFTEKIRCTHEGIMEATEKVLKWTIDRCDQLQQAMTSGVQKVYNAYEGILQTGRNISNAYDQYQYLQGSRKALKELKEDYVKEMNGLAKENEQLKVMKKEIDRLKEERTDIYESYKKIHELNIEQRKSMKTANNLYEHMQEEFQGFYKQAGENLKISELDDLVKNINDYNRNFQNVSKRIDEIGETLEENKKRLRGEAEEYKNINSIYKEKTEEYNQRLEKLNDNIKRQKVILSTAEKIVREQEEKFEQSRHIFKTEHDAPRKHIDMIPTDR